MDVFSFSHFFRYWHTLFCFWSIRRGSKVQGPSLPPFLPWLALCPFQSFSISPCISHSLQPPLPPISPPLCPYSIFSSDIPLSYELQNRHSPLLCIQTHTHYLTEEMRVELNITEQYSTEWSSILLYSILNTTLSYAMQYTRLKIQYAVCVCIWADIFSLPHVMSWTEQDQ